MTSTDEKIRFASGEELTVALYPDETEPCIFAKKLTKDGVKRTFLRLTVLAAHAEAAALFTDGADYSLIAADGEETPLSSFCVAGDIVDHRDGRVSVYMGEKTEGEMAYDALEADCAALYFALMTGGDEND